MRKTHDGQGLEKFEFNSTRFEHDNLYLILRIYKIMQEQIFEQKDKKNKGEGERKIVTPQNELR